MDRDMDSGPGPDSPGGTVVHGVGQHVGGVVDVEAQAVRGGLEEEHWRGARDSGATRDYGAAYGDRWQEMASCHHLRLCFDRQEPPGASKSFIERTVKET